MRNISLLIFTFNPHPSHPTAGDPTELGVDSARELRMSQGFFYSNPPPIKTPEIQVGWNNGLNI